MDKDNEHLAVPQRDEATSEALWVGLTRRRSTAVLFRTDELGYFYGWRSRTSSKLSSKKEAAGYCYHAAALSQRFHAAIDAELPCVEQTTGRTFSLVYCCRSRLRLFLYPPPISINGVAKVHSKKS